MRTISDAVAHVVEANPWLRAGLALRLMNLSQVARYILPAVAARTQKEVRPSAVAMALSRLQPHLGRLEGGAFPALAERITVQRGLAVLTFANSRRCQAALPRLQEKTRERHGFLTVTEGIREITLIVAASGRDVALETLPDRPEREAGGVAGLSIALTDENLGTPGVLYRLLQPLALQGVNVVEVASTTREFHVYIDEDDVMLALDSLYATFGRR